MKAWLSYAGWTGAVTLGLIVVVGTLVPASSTGAVWLAGVSAYSVQLIAFAALVVVRRKPRRFLFGWVGGIVLRATTVVVLAVLVLPGAAAALLSAVGILFVLMLMEPVFLRIAE